MKATKMNKKPKKKVIINSNEAPSKQRDLKIEDQLSGLQLSEDGDSAAQEMCSTIFSATRDQIRAEQQRQVVSRARPALNELLNAGSEMDHELFFKKFVALCITMSGLGSPNNSAVVKETYPALNSVLKAGDIARLMELPMNNREHNFLELIQIVMGIRLFNKDCLKGGEGIDDLPELLTRAVAASKDLLTDIEHGARTDCEKLTSKLTSIFLPQSLPSSNDDIFSMKKNLCSAWQRLLCLKRLSLELMASERHVLSCVDQLRQTLVQLHDTVRYRAAIPTVQVYPLFVQLSMIWRELQYETAVLSHFNRMFRAVAPTANKIKASVDRKVLAKKTTIVAEPDPNLQYCGFCPWTLVQTGGVLLVGSSVVENIAFRNSQCAEAWFKDAAKNEGLLHSVCSTFRELPCILSLFQGANDNENDLMDAKVEMVEAGVQTEVHPITSYIDSDYVWSNWTLKKKAVQLAKISLSMTKSQQTIQSSFHKDKSC